MSRKTNNRNGRSRSRPHIQLLKRVLDSDEFGQITGNAVKLLLEFHRQYNGFNNGDMCATWNQLKARGWKSKGTLARSIQELVAAEFIVSSRIAYDKRTPNLYALTYLAVDECSGKLDIPRTLLPPDSWKDKINSLPRMRGTKAYRTPHEG